MSGLKYLRIRIFEYFLRPFSERTRLKRMRFYKKLMNVRKDMSVIDLGGQPMIWDSVSLRQNITILNLPGIASVSHASHHRIEYVEGDACYVPDFADRSFDIVFSNSVIEHVGASDKQAEFAKEVRRLGRSYWVQTPSKWFPIEAHCGMPLWWFYPSWLRHYFIERWRKKIPAWTNMVAETTILNKADLRKLFPEATIWIERKFCLPKSYAAYFVGEPSLGDEQLGRN